jgi:hypothetical protein
MIIDPSEESAEKFAKYCSAHTEAASSLVKT